MKPTGGRLRGREKAKGGNLWDWIPSKRERHMLRSQHVEMVFGEQEKNAGCVLFPALCGCCSLRYFKVLLSQMQKGQRTGSMKAKSGLH